MQFIQGPDFPTAGFIYGQGADPRGLPRPAAASCTLRAKAEIERRQERPRGDHRHRDPVPGEQGAPDRAHRRAGARQASSTASATCATSPTAKACASSSSSSATPAPRSCSTSSTSTRRCRSPSASSCWPSTTGGRSCWTSRTCWSVFIDAPPRGGHPPHGLRAAQGRGAAHILEGLKIALENLDAGHRAHPRRRRSRDRARKPV